MLLQNAEHLSKFIDFSFYLLLPKSLLPPDEEEDDEEFDTPELLEPPELPELKLPPDEPEEIPEPKLLLPDEYDDPLLLLPVEYDDPLLLREGAAYCTGDDDLDGVVYAGVVLLLRGAVALFITVPLLWVLTPVLLRVVL